MLCFSDLAKFVDEKSRVASSMYGVDLTKETIQSKHEGASPVKNQNNGVKITTLATNGKGKKVYLLLGYMYRPHRYIAMVRQFHDGMQARVQNDGEYSEPFLVTNGVKQGYVMAPTLCSMMFSAMLTDAFQDVDAGFPIRYRFDDKLLNLRRRCKPNPRCRQMWLISSSMQMT